LVLSIDSTNSFLTINKRSKGFIAVATYIRTNQNPKERGGAVRRLSLLGFMP